MFAKILNPNKKRGEKRLHIYNGDNRRLLKVLNWKGLMWFLAFGWMWCRLYFVNSNVCDNGGKMIKWI